MKQGKTGSADGHIAAIAWANALTLVTANRGFDGSGIENWMRTR